MPTITTVTPQQCVEAYNALVEQGRRPSARGIRRYLKRHYGKGAGEETIEAMLGSLGFTYDPAGMGFQAPNSPVQPVEQPRPVAVEPPPPDFHQEKEARVESFGVDYWQKRYERLEAEYQKALESAVLTEYLAKEIIQLAPKSYSSAGKPPSPPSYGEGTPVSAVLVLSDWHFGKVVSAGQTLGVGEYSPNIALDRLAYLEVSATTIITKHTLSPVEELVIFVAGDMLDGALTHGAEAAQSMTLWDQWFQGGHALAQFIRNLASIVPRVRVFSVVGNHGRMPNQAKMPTKNRYSNFDHFLSAYARALVRDVRNVEWTLDRQPFAVFEVQGHVFYGLHGDTLKGGDKAFGVPLHSIGRLVNANTQLSVRHAQKPPAYFLMGDKHKSLELPHGLGRVIGNGAFTYVDEYALSANFPPQEPSQTLFMVHPKYGKGATYEVKLLHARPHMGRAYLEGLQ